MMYYLAHSAKGGQAAQRYTDHIRGVGEHAFRCAAEAERYAAQGGALTALVQKAAWRHDLGKLDDDNQSVLRSEGNARFKLPVNHVDAGCATLMKDGDPYAAMLVFSHHHGLPDITEQTGRMGIMFRDEHPALRERTDRMLPELLKRHDSCFQSRPALRAAAEYCGDLNVFFRMALSCLADADHTDTAAFYGQTLARETLPPLRARERLAALDRYVSTLNSGDARGELRRQMYEACRDAEIAGSFTVCDSPVGSGKTTAVMAHLLRQAITRNLRRIFVVLPYTSIIQQSVEVYRKALILPDEDPESVVAELHCRADFQDADTRYLTALWRAPIVVTTAVAFFETLASNRPSVLRRLHELPGSAIFVDEAHNALPLKLLPLAWKWMNALADEWGCCWVLASGSLVRYWDLARLSEAGMQIPAVYELVPAALREKLMQYEQTRVAFRWNPERQSRQALIEWVQSHPGPRLLILNTVQSAAVLASDLCDAYGRDCVEHLSTALTPEDRSSAIAQIRRRLRNPNDRNWTLVATSCVEAGVDFSFRTGFREVSSLLSLLQAAGRVNRHGEYADAEMWSFQLRDDSMLRTNKALRAEQAVLQRYFSEQLDIKPDLGTQFLNDVIAQDSTCLAQIKQMLRAEANRQFPVVEDQFRVIDETTVSAIVDEALVKEVSLGNGDWKQLQKKAVSIRCGNIRRWNLKEIAAGVYQWTLRYDAFLGYMRGVLDVETARNGFLNY